MTTIMFYLLSLVTGILECGWIVFGAIHALPLWQILCYPLAYHMGNLFPKPFTLGKHILVCMGILSVIISAIILINNIPENVIFLLTCISLCCLSAVIQSIRSEMKSDGNRLLKRIFRVGGFAFAPLTMIAPSIILILSSVIALIGLRNYKGKTYVSTMTAQRGYSVVMLFHQLHYFFYAHITLAIISLTFICNCSEEGGVFAILLFCGTWITYMSVEPIVSRLTNKVLPAFFIGHTSISVLLFSMSYVTEPVVFMILWLITGFGGGVVYTISARAKFVGSYDRNSMTIAENIGHTCGLSVAVVIAFVFGKLSLHILLIFSSVSALIAVLCMIIIFRKEISNEIITY